MNDIIEKTEEYYNNIFKIKNWEKTYINFHNHTLYSDWEHSVTEILSEAKDLWITHFSITDHDTLDSYIKWDAINISKKLWINLTPWVEVTVKTKKNVFFQVHILLYFEEKLLNNSDFIKDFYENIWNTRGLWLLHRRIESINKYFWNEWIELSLEDFDRLSLRNITTAHSAKALEKKYPNLSQKDITRIIWKKSPAYIKPWIDIETIMKIRKKYNLVSVMAHPIREKDTEYTEDILEYINYLIKNDYLDWLELEHPYLTNKSKNYLRKFKTNISTAWSDTHNKYIWRKVQNYNVNSVFNSFL